MGPHGAVFALPPGRFLLFLWRWRAQRASRPDPDRQLRVSSVRDAHSERLRRRALLRVLYGMPRIPMAVLEWVVSGLESPSALAVFFLRISGHLQQCLRP